MALSAMDWDLSYARTHAAETRKPDWTNPAPGNSKCLSSLSRLELHAQGNSGILSINKRPDNNGYTTTYRVPDNIYAAHLIVSITGYWKTGISTSALHQRYGAADEILSADNGLPFHRYWVISKNDKQMPTLVYAVDFEINNNAKTVSKYLIWTSDVEFVQQKLDALMRKWEKDYILD